jgi:hypothetical protein
LENGQVDEEAVQHIREERLASLLANEVLEND